MNKSDKRIVIIEDEPEWAEIVQSILIEEGYINVTMRNEQTSFNELSKGAFDLAIVDIGLKMSNKNGFQIKDYLKEVTKTKVILISGRTDYDLEVLNLARGADGWILKSTIMENVLKFLLLVEKVINKTEDNDVSQHISMRHPLQINVINQVGVSTVDQVELEKYLTLLKDELKKINIKGADDLEKDVDQLSLELSKKEKDRNFIRKIIEKLHKEAGPSITVITLLEKISDLIKFLL